MQTYDGGMIVSFMLLIEIVVRIRSDNFLKITMRGYLCAIKVGGQVMEKRIRSRISYQACSQALEMNGLQQLSNLWSDFLVNSKIKRSLV